MAVAAPALAGLEIGALHMRVNHASPFSRMIDSSFAFGDSLLIWNMIHLLV
jgi:hypothetical protein